MNNSPMRLPSATLRWRTLLGVSVGLFLAWDLLNAALAVYVPYTLHTGGVSALSGLVLTADADEALLGRRFASIDAQDPRLAGYLVAFMDTMCAQLMGFAIAYLGIVWFGLTPRSFVRAVTALTPPELTSAAVLLPPTADANAASRTASSSCGPAVGRDRVAVGRPASRPATEPLGARRRQGPASCGSPGGRPGASRG